MGRTCGTNEELTNEQKIVDEKLNVKRLFRRPRRVWKDKIKTDLGCQALDLMKGGTKIITGSLWPGYRDGYFCHILLSGFMALPGSVV